VYKERGGKKKKKKRGEGEKERGNLLINPGERR